MTAIDPFSDPSSPVLVLVCKRPRPGYGKQRLATEIGMDASCAVAQGLLDCALEDAAEWRGEFVIATSARSDLEWAQSLALRAQLRQHTLRIAAQTTGNLGERLNAMDDQLRRAGAQNIVFIGSDAPCLNARHFSAACHGLDGHDVVLGNSRDGGVTIMASRKPWPDMSALPWSTDKLGDALHKACLISGLDVLRMDGGFDIDTRNDLETLELYLSADRRPARQSMYRITRDVLANIT